MEFPARGLHGGKKQSWINANLDTIAGVHSALGFEQTCQLFNMKADTLISALQKQGKRHKPAVTKADKAFNLAYLNETRIHDLTKEVYTAFEFLSNFSEDFQTHLKQLENYFTVQAKTNELMANLCKDMSTSRVTYFTEHIFSKARREVGLTRKLERVGLTTKSKAGTDVKYHPGQLSHFRGPVRNQLTGPKARKISKHQYSHNRGWPDV